jgi:hypothetical protein
MSTDTSTSTSRRTPHLAVAALEVLAAAILAVQTVGALSQPFRDTGTATATGAVAALALVAAIAAGRRAPGAGVVAWLALAAAAALHLLTATAPPRYVVLVPLALAAGLMMTSAGRARPAAGSGPTPLRSKVTGGLAILLHVAVAWPYLVSGLVAPLYGVLLLWLVWVGYLVLLLRLARRGSPVALIVPPVALLTWSLVLYLGGELLGWAP